VSFLQTTMTFMLSSPVHSTGDRIVFRVDKPTVFDSHRGDAPILTASSLKGLLRSTAEGLLRSQQKAACLGPRPENLTCDEPGTACLICRHFGSPRIKSPLRFFDASFPDDTRATARTGIGLDRRRRTAKEDHLFTTEVVQARRFAAQITGLYAEANEAREAVALLYLAGKAVFALGGGRSRGLGHICLEAFDATIDGGSQDLESIMEQGMEILG
jgi:CRISPR/Cas system CSM-associated protein Csm3 (group 7 of RAMP superfamily)